MSPSLSFPVSFQSSSYRRLVSLPQRESGGRVCVCVIFVASHPPRTEWAFSKRQLAASQGLHPGGGTDALGGQWCPASRGFHPVGTQAHWVGRCSGSRRGEWRGVLLLLFQGQRSCTQVRNYFTITVSLARTCPLPCTLTPHPGFVFPAQSPDRTWLGASLSGAAMPKQALQISGLSEKASSGVPGPRGSPLAGWQLTPSTSSRSSCLRARQAGDSRSPPTPTAQHAAGPQHRWESELC